MFSTIYDMSRGLVNQKPFSRKKRRQSFRKMLNRSGVSVPEFEVSKKIRNILSRWLCFTVLVIIWIVILIKSLFFKPEQRISQVKFSDNTLATYQDIELFNLISNNVKWKNYYMLVSNKDELLKKIQRVFPFVLQVDFQLEQWQEEIINEDEKLITWIKFPIINGTWDLNWTWWTEWFHFLEADFPLKLSQKPLDNWWTLWIQLTYLEPRVLVKLNGKKFAVRTENIFTELQNWMLLSTTKIDPKWDDTVDNLREIFTIETPAYVTWSNSLSWFFFEMSLDKVVKIASLAKEEFWNNMVRFVYLVWSTRFAIFTSDDKTLYFNFPEWLDIDEQRQTQIFKYNTLRDRYQKFSKIEKIDLWALEENKTIITNY